jgi:DNA-binding response OmpR family regulator
VGDAAAGGADEARRLMSSHPYNIVIINTPLPDDFGLRLAVDLIRYESTAVPFIR